MRQIPQLASEYPPSFRNPVAPDTPEEAMTAAYGQNGISSVAGLPGVEANVPPPRFRFDEYGQIIPPAGSALPVDSVHPGTIDPREARHDNLAEEQRPIPPQVSNDVPPPVSANERTAMLDGNRGAFPFGGEPRWHPICHGTIEDVLMSADGAHVQVLSDDGVRFAAFIVDRPIIRIGIRVELGMKYVVDGSTQKGRSVADVIFIGE
jgi:hypothetical protein